MHPSIRHLGVLAAAAVLAACSDGADTTTDDASVPASPPASEAADGTLEVVGVDYAFEGVDGPVAPGTALTFRNDSDTEYHEMAVMRVADDEERSVQELLDLPEEEAMAAMTFVGVAAAAPGESSAEAVDGTLVLDEPGRYVMTCFIPQGADPEVVAQAFEEASDGPPPNMGEGTPHAFMGMVGELRVE